MPFKSEAQRRYLWANEPEIARDWTDEYGSGIHKAKGGRIGLAKGRDPSDYMGGETGGRQAMKARASQSQRQRDRTDRAINQAVAANAARSQPKSTLDKIRDASSNLQKRSMTSYFDKTIGREKDALRRFHGITTEDEDERERLLNAYQSVDPLQFTKNP